MKKIIILIFTCIYPTLNAGIVNNSGATAADSLTIQFFLLDSTGNITTLDTSDSLGLVVFYPEGAVAYNSSILGNNGNIISQTVSNIGTVYSYAEAVSVLDGSSPVNGIYKWIFVAKDISLGLATPFQGEFQLYTTADYHTRLNNLDSPVSTRSTFNSATDSVQANANVLAVSDDTDAADSLEALVDGESDFQLELKQLFISNNTGSAIYASSQSASGHGLYLEATQSGNGFYALNTGNGNGMKVEAGGAGDGAGLLAIGKGAGADINASQFQEILDSIANISGSGSSADSTSISRWVWNTPQLNHALSGTFGDYLDADISGLSVGSGIYSYTFIIVDSANNQPIPGVNVVVKNLSQSTVLAVGAADNEGEVSFNLDNGSYIVLASAPGYYFQPYDTLHLSGSGTDSLFGNSFDPGNPAQPSFCRVYGYLYSFTGQPEPDASVTAALPNGAVQFNNLIISPFEQETLTDSIGYFYLDLLPSASLIPENQKYDVTIRRNDGTILRQRIIVPQTDSWQLSW